MTQNHVKSSSKISPLQSIRTGAAVSVLLLVLILWIYYSESLSEAMSPFWKDKLLDVLILIPALGSAVASVLFLCQFEKGETPYHIWQAFSIGLWCWTAGEIVGMVNDALYWYTTYPDFSLVDVLWLLGYFFLGLSLYYQLRLAYGVRSGYSRRIYLGLVALALLIAAGLTNLAEQAGLGEGYAWIILFVTVLYPVFDITEGTVAIWLSLLFGRGQWSRPWWGLILFALADSIDSFYWLGGYDFTAASMQSVLNFLSVAAYPASYMVTGLALLSNYFILRYGEESGLFNVKGKGGIN